MNHYPRNIGDYVRDTLGLSMQQDGAYTRLMDQYYASEKPLPLDRGELYGIARCRDATERKAVEFVLQRFFTETPDGFRQKRCDVELEEMVAKSRSASRSAKRRWSERNANASPNAHANAMRTDMPSESVGNARQEPRTKNQSKTLEALSGKPDFRSQAKDALDRLNRLTGRAYRDVPANLNPIVARLREGYTERDLRLVIATKCNEWGADEKMVEFLRPKTLFNRTNFASYAGQIPPLQEVTNGT